MTNYKSGPSATYKNLKKGFFTLADIFNVSFPYISTLKSSRYGKNLR